MEKIGILTFHRADNYGAVLQNYALVKCIQSFNENISVETIDYRCQAIEKPYQGFVYDSKGKTGILYLKGYTRSFLRYIKNYSKIKRRRNAFEAFRKTNLNMTSKSFDDYNVSELSDTFDLVITGSDQVWNSKITGKAASAVYSLEFCKGIRKISYAASAGSQQFIEKETYSSIKELETVSVREQNIKEFFEEKLCISSRIDVDPVFLLNKDRWTSISGDKRIVNDRYIFIYSVGDKMNEVLRIAEDLALKMDCKIIHVDINTKNKENSESRYDASPFEFVNLIRNASYIVASSFHAIAFSILLNRDFIAVPCSGTGSRVTELLNEFDLASRIVNSYKEYSERLFDTIDYTQQNKTIAVKRDESISYLKNTIIR